MDETHLADDKTVAGSLAFLLGAKADTKPAALGILSEADCGQRLEGPGSRRRCKTADIDGAGASKVDRSCLQNHCRQR